MIPIGRLSTEPVLSEAEGLGTGFAAAASSNSGSNAKIHLTFSGLLQHLSIDVGSGSRAAIPAQPAGDLAP